MHDIFGVFGPVLDFPRVLPQIVLVPQFVGEKTADFPDRCHCKGSSIYGTSLLQCNA